MYLGIVVKVFTTRLGIESDSFPPLRVPSSPSSVQFIERIN